MRYFYVQNGPKLAGFSDKKEKSAPVLPEVAGLRELLMEFLDDVGKKRLADQNKTNPQRFSEYDNDLKLSFQSTPKQLDYQRWMIRKFSNFLGERPHSVELAKEFLAQSEFNSLKPSSLSRYYGMIKRFLYRQCGIKLEIPIQKTHSLPEEIEAERVEKLRSFIAGKHTHKDTVKRDLLMMDVACLAALRASELANLKTEDILFESRDVFVKGGKGNKDRVIPLDDQLFEQLREYLKGRMPEESVFGLTAHSISNKITLWGKKSGTCLHTHSLRHFAAEQLRDSGAELDVIQDILGHNSADTTRMYMAQDKERMRWAIDRRRNPKKKHDQIKHLTEQVDKLVKDRTPDPDNIQTIAFPKSNLEEQQPD